MAGQIYIGIAGWSYPDWQGIVYTSKKVDQLEYVSSFVDCLEINSTFYRPPNERNTKSWLRRTAAKPSFFFTAKLHRDFTHEGKIDKSWENPDALNFLQDLGVTVCNLDYPITWNSFNMQHCTVGRNGYLRMHGRNREKWFSKAGRDETYDYYYNENELAQIKKRIDKLADAFESLTVIANNHYRGAELANAIELKALVSEHRQLVPEGLLRSYPNLARIALNA